MSYRDGHFQDLKVPLTWTVGVAVVVAGVILVALILGDRRETVQNGAYGAVRAVADVAASPVGQVLSAPRRLAGQVTRWFGDYYNAVEENRRLRLENADLRQWKATAAALRNTNERYRALLGFHTDPPIDMATAQVILESRGPFAETRLADAGRDRGVAIGNPVMNERGLVGRVIGVTRGASRILLVTDVASRTPVLVDRTDARAIMTGDATDTPRLDYLRGVDPIRNGDRILTSGDGGMIPRGLPVGTAVKGLDGTWRVRLDADESAVDVVRIMLFKDFSQLVNQQELSQTAAPAPPPAAPPVPTLAPAPSRAGAVRLAPARPAPPDAPTSDSAPQAAN